ncbi:hypothetical protein [Herbiconiux sp. UC225_62]|uniref:hypothetical protein n=1 Tax=Herbiconiux sp. UC225_62 TaxID=3350168 RepID=UPI0036D22595
MSEITQYQPDRPSDSLLARIPGTTAWTHRREDIERERGYEVQVRDAAHRGALEHQRIADAASHGRSSVAAAGAIAETTIQVNTAVGAIASAAHSAADPVTQLLIVDAVAVLAPQINAVAGSHISGLRR